MAHPHFFATCQVGAEAALKDELRVLRPAWRFAFSRPGLVTWRCVPACTPDEPVPSVFARVAGASLGRFATAPEIVARARALGGPLRLHVFARDRLRPGDRADDPTEADATAAATREALRAHAPAGLFQPDPVARAGDLVLDVVVAPGEASLVGLHRQRAGACPHPGGRWPLVLPAEAPSRTWLKLEEGLAFAGFAPRPEEVAVEIGSAPGGASWALLQRGLEVVGVDPGAMDARVLAHPRFTHLATTLGAVRREALPARVDWLLLDVNLAPQVALHGVRRLVRALRGGLSGALLTLKLNDRETARAVPDLLARVRGMGLGDVRATQLGSSRREICVAARPAGRQRGARRL